MSMRTKAIPTTETNHQTAPNGGRTEREHRAPDSGADHAPGLVIPGERLQTEAIPEGGERLEIVAAGNGKARLIAHPLPSLLTPKYSAITDWLNCTWPLHMDRFSLSVTLQELTEVLGPQFVPVRERGKGLNGYERSFALGEDGAMFAFGGQSNTGYLMLPAQACHAVSNWPAIVELLLGSYRARITRWDGAVDDFAGEHSVDDAVAMYKAGQFTNGGNRPSCRQNGNWIEPDGSGRTFYVGKRKNGKMLRVYEKGMQCGIPWHSWVRWEAELHNIDREIPWAVLLAPGRYFVGTYPNALGWVQDEMSRIDTVKNEMALSYEHMVGYAAKAYGGLINVMMEVEESPEKVIEQLRRDTIPKRLRFPIVSDGVK